MNERARTDRLLAAAVAATGFAAFAPALSAGFVSWDDSFLIIENPWIRGLAPAHIRWMASAVLGGIWQPVSWVSLALDYSLWGLEPAGFHLTNVLLHAATSALFYFVCLRLLKGSRGAALLAALFFAVHPLRVESVAWAAERKGLLSGFFCMAALLSHLRGRTRVAAAVFALSLLSKASSLPLPFALVVLEIYPLGRLPPDPRKWAARSLRPVWLALAPLFVLSAGAFTAGMLAGRAAGVITSASTLGPAWTVSRVLYSLLFYPAKTALPLFLSPYYPPQPWFGRATLQFAACAGLAATFVAAVVTTGRRRPAVAAAFAWYALMLLPMAGFVQHGVPHSAADRFSYLPCLGFAVLFGSALARGRAAPALATAWLLVLGAASWRQSSLWRDSTTLWTAAVKRAPGAVARGELGAALIRDGRAPDGIALLRTAIEHPAAPSVAYVNLGEALRKQGLKVQAIEAWRLGLAAAPSPELSALLGASLTKDDVRAATALLLSAVAAEPSRASWRVDLGDALAHGGRGAAAKREYETALNLEPELGRGHNNFGMILEREGRMEEAAAHYRTALRDPGSRAAANHNLGNVFLADGRVQDAERRYREALRLDPALSRTRVNLGNILARRGDYAAAAELYRAALKTDPRSVEALANLRAVSPRVKRTKRAKK